MRHRDIRTLRRQKRAPITLQHQRHQLGLGEPENDSQQRMDAAFEQLERERAQMRATSMENTR